MRKKTRLHPQHPEHNDMSNGYMYVSNWTHLLPINSHYVYSRIDTKKSSRSIFVQWPLYVGAITISVFMLYRLHANTALFIAKNGSP